MEEDPPASFGTEDRECPICLEPLPKIGSASTTTTTTATSSDDDDSDDDSEDDMTILDLGRLVQCGHTFHQSCLNSHEEVNAVNATCPLCRASILSDDRSELLAWTANQGGTKFVMNLLTMFDDHRFYRDNQDIAKQEAIADGEDVGLITDLIQEGVDVNSSYPDGNNGLMMATMNGRVDVIRCFLEHGVNVNAVSLYGRTAMDEVDDALQNQQEVKELLQNAGALCGKDVCANCGTTRQQQTSGTLNRCGKCKGIFYCGRACQRNHWPKHKEYCTPT